MFEEGAPGMEIYTCGACWSVGHTTVQGHSRGRGLSYQPCTCTHIYVGVCICLCVLVVVLVGGGWDGSASWAA